MYINIFRTWEKSEETILKPEKSEDIYRMYVMRMEAKMNSSSSEETTKRQPFELFKAGEEEMCEEGKQKGYKVA